MLQLTPKTSPLLAVAFLLAVFFFLPITSLQADTIQTLEAEKNRQLAELEKLDAEIKSLNGKILTTSSQAASLKTEIGKLEATRQKLLSSMKATQIKIDRASATITQLGGKIKSTEETINGQKSAIAEALRALTRFDSVSLLEVVLAADSLSQAAEESQQFRQLQEKLYASVRELKHYTTVLSGQKATQEKEKKQLTSFKNQLADEAQIARQTQTQKNSLLSVTKNQESAYKQLLADRLKKKQQVEGEISAIEAQIKIAIDPSSLPKTGINLLSWPLSNIIITQHFGNTDFATKNPQVYNGHGHNGMDFGASIGTPIFAPADGVVSGIGNTDLTCAGASYGKWILLKHDNGLSTLSAHLSLIKVSPTNTVKRGEIIGYTGNTGYTTGPHLHFTVYASQAVSIQNLKSRVPGCGTYVLPVASYNGYLNPLSYLPGR